MTNKQDFIEDLKKFSINKKLLSTSVKEYVQDVSINLENRWEIFCKAGKLGLIETEYYCFYPNGIDWNSVSLYDDFYIDKYQTYDVLDILERGIDDNIDINQIEYKESCMQEFIFKAINEW
jgi:hypothetical protein